MSEEVVEPRLHELKDKWFVFYVPAVTEGEVYEHETKELGYVGSIEEAYGTLNTLPNVTLLPPHDNVVFSRNKIDPKYESLPGGTRYSIFCKTKTQSLDAVAYVMAIVLGEAIARDVTNGQSVCDVVRICHKPGIMYKDAVRIEVWTRKTDKSSELQQYFSRQLSSIPGVHVQMRDLN